MIKDNGGRREFETGAVRDIQEGKGRCDLLPIKEVVGIMGIRGGQGEILTAMGDYIRTRDEGFLWFAVKKFLQLEGVDKYTAVLEVSKHYEEGCNKYGPRNWEKGIPTHSYFDSAVRHLLKHFRGDTDERHDRAFIWNVLGLAWTMHNKPELDDLPGGNNNDTNATNSHSADTLDECTDTCVNTHADVVESTEVDAVYRAKAEGRYKV